MTERFLIDCVTASEQVGSLAWWRQVRARGTPLRESADEGWVRTCFVWRDPQGDQSSSDVVQVYIDVYSHTPHPCDALTSLQRLPDTDVWYWQTRLPEDWCGSYVFVPARADQLLRSGHDRRAWWQGLLAVAAQADSLNIHPAHSNGWGLPLSALLTEQDDRVARQNGWYSEPMGRLSQWIWHSTSLGNARDIWLYEPRGARRGDDAGYPLIVMLDGHYWAEHMPLFGEIDVMTARGELPVARYLMVDSIDPATRYLELGCYAPFWHAIESELLPQVAVRAGDDACAGPLWVAGQSLGGLAAIYAALHRPARYAMALSQSGSFWWPTPEGDPDHGWLVRQVNARHLEAGNAKFLLQSGREELADMRAVSQTMAAALGATGHQVRLDTFAGGHDWLCWRRGLLQGISQLWLE